MNVVLHHLGLRSPRKARQCFSDWLRALYLGATTVATPGWMTEVVLVGSVEIGRLNLNKMDQALGEPTESCT